MSGFFRSLMLIPAFAISTLTAAAEPAFPSPAPWFNVSRPLSTQDLRGRVVLFDFFTPGCINCIHMLPELERLQHEFGQSLLIIGVNSPKFIASQHSDNIEGFIQRYNIRHPILTDQGMILWHHYGVFAWPTLILLGPDGQVAGRYIGEGHYTEIRHEVIQTLAQARKNHQLIDTPLPLQPPVQSSHGLLQPGKITVQGNLVAIADTGHNRILLLDRSGKVLRIIGNGHPGDRNGAPEQAEFRSPQGLAFVGQSLYVADTDNQLIRRIDLANDRVSTVAGNGQRRFAAMGKHPARSVALNSPWALQAVDRVLYIAMAGEHQIWQLNLADEQIGPYAGSGREGINDGSLAQASFAQSSGLAYHQGILYVADPEASALRAIHLDKGQVHTLIGEGLFAFGLRNGSASQALLQHDQGLSWLDGRLYIADTFNNAIRVFDPRTMQVSTLATGLDQPGGLVAFNADTLLVADTNANRIVMVNTRSGVIRPWPIQGL